MEIEGEIEKPSKTMGGKYLQLLQTNTKTANIDNLSLKESTEFYQYEETATQRGIYTISNLIHKAL